MKILYIIAKSTWGGAQRHVFDLARQAKKKGFDVAVVLGGEGVFRQKLDEAGIRSISLGSFDKTKGTMQDGSSFSDIFNTIKSEKPDVLHLNDPKAGGFGSLAGRIIRLISRKSGLKKIVYTTNGWAWTENRPFLQRIGIVFFSWLTMLLATDIIIFSQKESDEARTFPFIKKKIHYIPLGITPPVFYGHKNALDCIEKYVVNEKPRSPLERRPIIGTISELHPNKGLVYLIEAAREIKKRFPSVAIIIIGEGTLRSTLEELIKKYDLTETVYLAGYLDQASQYIKAFNIFCLTPIKEGVPYSLFEAAYAGIPILATAVGGIPEVLQDMSSGILIQPKKPVEIIHALSFLLDPNHKPEQKIYAEALRQHIEVNFPIEKMFEKTFQVYGPTNSFLATSL